MLSNILRSALTAAIPLLAACATITTQLAPVAPEAIAAEEALQRELVLVELNSAQQRLDDLAFPLLVAATPLCDAMIAPRFGVSFASAHDYENEWVAAAKAGLSLGDTLSVVNVTVGSPAAEAGLEHGDEVLALNGTDIPVGLAARRTVNELLDQNGEDPLRMSLRRDGSAVDAVLIPVVACNFTAVVIVEGDINAYANGEQVIIPWAMMRFAKDDELVGVLGHEIAHNAMGHIEARKKNAIWGALFGALFDVAAATQGVNTGGQNTANFMAAAAQAYSRDFEREADYVGMYILARAGRPLETVPNFWRQFAQINPSAISYATTHPTTAERFVRLKMAADEIEAKRARGEQLMPEMKPGASTATANRASSSVGVSLVSGTVTARHSLTRVYDSTDADAKVVFRVLKGAQLPVVSESSGWIRVVVEGREVFVKAADVVRE